MGKNYDNLFELSKRLEIKRYKSDILNDCVDCVSDDWKFIFILEENLNYGIITAAKVI